MLDLAAREPATLVLGLDASTAAMIEASRRAAEPAAAFEPLGFEMVAGREASGEEVAASGSSWAKRLAAGRNGDAGRIVTLIRLVRRARR